MLIVAAAMVGIDQHGTASLVALGTKPSQYRCGGGPHGDEMIPWGSAAEARWCDEFAGGTKISSLPDGVSACVASW